MSPSNVASPRANRKPTRPRLPRYVNVFTDRHGKQRSYFRHAGNRTPLRSELGSPEWWREYSDALAGRTVARPGLPVTPRVSAGSVASVIAGVVASAKYQKLRRTSRRSYQRSFQILRDLAGDMLIRKMKREHFVKIVDAQQRVSIGAGNEMLKVCRVVGRHARLLGLIEHDPVADLHKQGPKQRGGHHTWLPEEAAQFRKHHPPGSLARLVFELAHETGLRRGDLCRVGWEHMAEGKIRIVPTKPRAPRARPRSSKSLTNCGSRSISSATGVLSISTKGKSRSSSVLTVGQSHPITSAGYSPAGAVRQICPTAAGCTGCARAWAAGSPPPARTSGKSGPRSPTKM
jgi:hypothetical protein